MGRHPKVTHLLIEAVRAGMKVVRSKQGLPMDVILKPEDDTLKTEADTSSELAMTPILTGYPVRSEESDTGPTGAEYEFLADPNDGTGALANGLMTSTVIAGFRHTASNRLIASAIGEAVSGRLWFADTETKTQLWRSLTGPVFVGGAWDGRRDRSWDLQFDYGFLDVSHGYKKGLTNEQMAKLKSSMALAGLKYHVPGSNGLIHAVVANGASIAAGSISTAKGGPWDFCGALLVTQAGGFVAGFRKEGGKLIACDGLDPYACDFLVTANSTAILKVLSDMLLAAYR